MGPHDLDDDISAEPADVIRTHYWVGERRFVCLRLVLQQGFDAESSLQRPLHVGDEANAREPQASAARANPFDQVQHPVLIEASDLVKRFGEILAVDGISLEVRRGEVLGFLGPNGAGKSTTMKMLTGFLEPDAGSARIAGIDMLEEPKQAKRQLGYLPEGAPCYGDMTAHGFAYESVGRAPEPPI